MLVFDAPTCLLLSLWLSCGIAVSMSFSKVSKSQNWRLSCTKCSFSGSHLSPLESLAFLWLRRLYGGSSKTSHFRRSQSVTVGGSLARNARFEAPPTCFVFSLWLSSGFAVSLGEAAKLSFFEGFQVSKLEEVSHEMLVLMLPHVSSCVSGFSLPSPCLWGKLQNMSRLESLAFLCLRRVYGGSCKTFPFWKVSKFQNWRIFRTKCSFSGSNMSRLESLAFLWRGRVYVGSCKICRLRSVKVFKLLEVSHQMLVLSLDTLGTLYSTLYTLQSTLHTPDFTL